MPGAAHHRGSSAQDVQTPGEFILAAQRRFGPIAWDLAAGFTTAVVPRYFGKAQDSLAQDWRALRGVLWCNPPYENVVPWARKASEEIEPGGPARLLLLVPASVGSLWFSQYIAPWAVSLVLQPRLKFVGHEHPFPRDLMLSVYGGVDRGVHPWQWRDK